jgi:hypothetical protein
MPDEALFEYYGIQLTGLVVSNRQEDDQDDSDEQEPDLFNTIH